MPRILTLSRSWLFIVTLGIAISVSASPAAAEDLDEFAECIAESGAVFYGAHWCPYCAKQMKAFGASAHLLPYVECYEPGTRNKLDDCDHVRKFPTWEFAGGAVRTGFKSLEKLAAATGCSLP